MESSSPSDLVGELERACRKLEAAIAECERLLEMKSFPTQDVLATALGHGPPEPARASGPPPKVQR